MSRQCRTLPIGTISQLKAISILTRVPQVLAQETTPSTLSTMGLGTLSTLVPVVVNTITTAMVIKLTFPNGQCGNQ